MIYTVKPIQSRRKAGVFLLTAPKGYKRMSRFIRITIIIVVVMCHIVLETSAVLTVHGIPLKFNRMKTAWLLNSLSPFPPPNLPRFPIKLWESVGRSV